MLGGGLQKFDEIPAGATIRHGHSHCVFGSMPAVWLVALLERTEHSEIREIGCNIVSEFSEISATG